MTQTAFDFTAPLRFMRYPPEGTQARAILDALLAGQSLTPLDALRRFGCNRLAARIYDLQTRYGWSIDAKPEHEGRKTWARYSMRRA